MIEELIYSILFLLMGAIALIWAKRAPKTRDDPFAIKVSQYTMGIISILAGLYLLFNIIVR